ncbi:uncharacterized protein [Atheta coriaria]|uniref:uncharacterized protein n=1 Tax=Dalotia coriaria TaxID=877792 RepID=UPI0031F39C6C
MEVFHQEIQDLLNHCQKTDINFDVIYKNALLSLNSQDNLKIKLPSWKPQITMEQVKIFFKSWRFLILFTVLTILLFTYLQLELINIHISAIGRIIMVQVLPFYDWRPLKNERCLLKKSAIYSSGMNGKTTNIESDCNYCDGINSVPKLKYLTGDWNNDDLTQEELVSNLAQKIKSYYDIDAPIVIANKSDASFNIENLKQDLEYIDYIPCNVESNIYIRKSSTVEDILIKLDKAPFFFAQWRNCNLHAMKLFRRFFPRPEYLHVNFAPIQQSWFIVSKNYYSENQNYKQLKLTDRLALVAIIEGHFKVRLIPLRYCFIGKMCNDVIIDMFAGDALVLSDQWEIEYLFMSTNDDVKQDFEVDLNMAIVLETH